MKKFYRQIDNDMICVFVDDSVFKCFGEIIVNILRTYVPLCDNIDLLEKNCFYIIPETEKFYYPSQQSYVIYENDENWLLGLINDLDVFQTEILKCTVVHGSCVKVADKNILIVGERWSGKTTLTHFFISCLDGEYISDDCVYLKNKRFLGFCMPLPIRNYDEVNVDKTYNDNILTVFCDSDGIERTLLIPQNIRGCIDKIDYIFFPKYTSCTEGKISAIESIELFKKIISNIRAYSSMKEMYNDITNLLDNTKAYTIEYSSSDMACGLLKYNNII